MLIRGQLLSNIFGNPRYLNGMGRLQISRRVERGRLDAIWTSTASGCAPRDILILLCYFCGLVLLRHILSLHSRYWWSTCMCSPSVGPDSPDWLSCLGEWVLSLLASLTTWVLSERPWFNQSLTLSRMHAFYIKLGQFLCLAQDTTFLYGVKSHFFNRKLILFEMPVAFWVSSAGDVRFDRRVIFAVVIRDWNFWLVFLSLWYSIWRLRRDLLVCFVIDTLSFF